jgi:hypothetical protein
MNTGQTILTIGAFVLLTTILQGLYNSLGNVGADISSGQDGILATTIATSYSEMVNRLAFDQVTDTSDVALASPLLLSYPCGPEAGEDSIAEFNDFDDFNRYSEVKVAGGSGRSYRTTFIVSYVDEANLSSIVAVRTYLKRMDMKTWRVAPPPTSDEIIDTLTTSLVMGYYHFD